MSYTKPDFELSDIAREFGDDLRDNYNLTAHQKKVLTRMCQCRTAELGGHKEQCNNADCNNERYAYNGCRDRHCPKCNVLKREKWVMDRKADALPVPYFHIVFTIPGTLESQCLSHGKEMYNLLFKSAWDTLQFFACKHNHLGADIGMTCVLHTWGQNLARHTHLHCLVPAGGITMQKKWRAAKSDGKFFVHVKLLSKVFRGKFTDGLVDLQNQGIIQLEEEIKDGLKHLHPLYNKSWVVYAKKPLPTSDKVVEYIGRYSHRVAISNHRIKEVKDGEVTFSWLNYHTGKNGLMPLKATDFLHRFILHVLPVSFIKIRHYGILSTRNKTGCIALVRKLFDVPAIAKIPASNSWMDIYETAYGKHPKLCPCCKKGVMMTVESYLPKHLLRNRGDPDLTQNMAFDSQQH
jgi:hypothetical protein